MPPIGVPTWRSHFGMAQEATFGSTVATPTVWLPVNSFDEYDDDMGLVFDEGKRNTPAKLIAVYSGVQQGKYGATFNYYPNEAVRFWAGILGNDTVSAASSNGYWPHTIIASTGQPYSYTLFDYFGTTGPERQFTGATMDSLNFKFDRASGAATIKAHWASMNASTGITETTPVFGTEPFFRGWEAVFAINASTKVTLLTYDITATRDVNMIFAANNSQDPSFAEVGAIDVTGKLSLYASTDGVYTDYRAGTQQPLDIVLTDTLAGSSGARLEILLTKAIFTNVKPDRSGPYVRWDVDFRGVTNATDGGGPFQVLATVATSSSLST